MNALPQAHRSLISFLWNISEPERFAPRPLQIDTAECFIGPKPVAPAYAAGTELCDPLPEDTWPLANPNEELALVTEHPDKPGQIERVTSILAGWGVNVAGASVRRNQKGGRALLITLVDDEIPDGAIKVLTELKLRPERWNWAERDDLNLTEFPLGSTTKGSAVVTCAPDRPGQIARAARILAEMKLNSTGFLVYRERLKASSTVQVNLLDDNPFSEAEDNSNGGKPKSKGGDLERQFKIAGFGWLLPVSLEQLGVMKAAGSVRPPSGS